MASMAGVFLVVLLLPSLREFFALDLPSATLFLAAIGIAAIACGVLELSWHVAGWVDRRPGLPDLGIALDDLDVSDERFPIAELLSLGSTLPGMDRLSFHRRARTQTPPSRTVGSDAGEPGAVTESPTSGPHPHRTSG